MTEKQDQFKELSMIATDLVSKSYNNGRNDEKERIISFLMHCAENLDFGNDTPNHVIKELCNIMMEKEHEPQS